MKKKEVKNTHINTLSYELLLNLLNELKSPSKVANRLGISKQAINPYIRTLKANGNIKMIGYGTWEVKNYTYNTLAKQVKIRGHAFIHKITISKDIDWSKFNLKKLKNVYQIKINNKKVWLSHRKVTIYEIKDFNGIDAIESRKLAINEMVKDLDTLKKTLNINFNYGFETAREHYSMIHNELASIYNKRKEKMIIKDDSNKEWLWIDFSDGVDELETNKLMNSKQVQNWWNDNKKYDFKVTPTFLLESINKVTNNQIMFAKNMESHIKAIKQLGNAVNRLSNVKTKKIKTDLKEGVQRKLFEF